MWYRNRQECFSGGAGAVVTPSAKTENVTNRTETTTVDAATAEKIVEKAVENKSETVIINGVNRVTAVADKASGTDGNVKITVKKVGEDSSKLKLDIKIETVNGEVKYFDGGSMTVTVKLSDKLAEKELVCVNIDDKGIYHRVKG